MRLHQEHRPCLGGATFETTWWLLHSCHDHINMGTLASITMKSWSVIWQSLTKWNLSGLSSLAPGKWMLYVVEAFWLSSYNCKCNTWGVVVWIHCRGPLWRPYRSTATTGCSLVRIHTAWRSWQCVRCNLSNLGGLRGCWFAGNH